MAKRRRNKQTQERFTRAQPRELKTIRLRRIKPVEEKTKKALINTAYLVKPKSRYIKNTIKLGNTVVGSDTNVAPTLKKVHTIACKAKKAKARHNYFSMRKSGKGASRTNPKTDRFNSRC